MAFHDIAKEKLDAWWREACAILNKDPGNWDAVERIALIENEYARRGWKPPKE